MTRTNVLTPGFRKNYFTPGSFELNRVDRCKLNALANHNTPLAFTDFCGFAQTPVLGAFLVSEETSPSAPTNGIQFIFFQPKTNTTETLRGILFCAGIDYRTVDNFNPMPNQLLSVLCETVKWFNLNGSV